MSKTLVPHFGLIFLSKNNNKTSSENNLKKINHKYVSVTSYFYDWKFLPMPNFSISRAVDGKNCCLFLLVNPCYNFFVSVLQNKSLLCFDFQVQTVEVTFTFSRFLHFFSNLNQICKILCLKMSFYKNNRINETFCKSW